MQSNAISLAIEDLGDPAYVAQIRFGLNDAAARFFNAIEHGIEPAIAVEVDNDTLSGRLQVVMLGDSAGDARSSIRKDGKVRPGGIVNQGPAKNRLVKADRPGKIRGWNFEPGYGGSNGILYCWHGFVLSDVNFEQHSKSTRGLLTAWCQQEKVITDQAHFKEK